jgi:hypothetical protein
MSDLTNELTTLSRARYGSEMRSALYSAISIMADDTNYYGSNITNWMNHMPSSFSVAVNYTGVVTRSAPTITDNTTLTIGKYAFAYCTALSEATFNAVMSIEENAFEGCTSLEDIYLLGSSVPALVNDNAFANTPIGAMSGHIYVLPSMSLSFLASTAWSTFFSLITPYSSS